LAPPRTRARRLLVSLGAALLGLALSAAPAGANVISPEAPHSPNADDLYTLYWIGLVVMCALVAIVIGALVWAVVRFRDRRGQRPRQIAGLGRIQARVGGGLAVFAALMFTVSVVFTERARDVASTGPDGLQKTAALTEGSGAAPIGTSTPSPSSSTDPLEITATAQQWLWRYTYPNGAFSFYKLVVPVDTAVQLNLVTTDVVHGWFVPALGGKFDAVPGKTNHAWFKADETGTYSGRSSTFSGAAYAAERIEVEVVTPEQFENFVKRQLRDIQEAQDIVVQQIQSGQTP
jgi:cytochrome c oxidase subunit II